MRNCVTRSIRRSCANSRKARWRNRFCARFLDTAIQESLKVPARVWRAAFEGFLEDDVARDLGVMTAPTLIVWGDRDSFCRREDQDALRAALPHARFVVYEKAGHALHWEEPERFAAEIDLRGRFTLFVK